MLSQNIYRVLHTFIGHRYLDLSYMHTFYCSPAYSWISTIVVVDLLTLDLAEYSTLLAPICIFEGPLTNRPLAL